MNMRKIIKIGLILIMLMTISIQNNIVYAEGTAQVATWSTKSADWWKPKDEEVGQLEMKAKTKIILGYIRSIGIIVSVIALMIIGIRQMTASAEEKSIIKESMPGYVIGLIMVVAVTVLPSIIYDLMKGL